MLERLDELYLRKFYLFRRPRYYLQSEIIPDPTAADADSQIALVVSTSTRRAATSRVLPQSIPHPLLLVSLAFYLWLHKSILVLDVCSTVWT